MPNTSDSAFVHSTSINEFQLHTDCAAVPATKQHLIADPPRRLRSPLVDKLRRKSRFASRLGLNILDTSSVDNCKTGRGCLLSNALVTVTLRSL